MALLITGILFHCFVLSMKMDVTQHDSTLLHILGTSPKTAFFWFSKKFEAKLIRNEENYYIVKDYFTKISNHHTRGKDTQQFMLKNLSKPVSLCGHLKSLPDLIRIIVHSIPERL